MYTRNMNNTHVIRAKNIESGMEIVGVYGTYTVKYATPLAVGLGLYISLETTDGPRMMKADRLVGIIG